MVRASVSLLHRRPVHPSLVGCETAGSHCDGLPGVVFSIQVRFEIAENVFWRRRISWYIMVGRHRGRLNLHSLISFSYKVAAEVASKIR